MFDLEAFTRTPRLDAMPATEARLAMAVRLFVVMRTLNRDPTDIVAERLGSATVARRLALVMDQISAAWTEPFRVNPPCCPRLSHDEALLMDMIGHAAAHDRAGFDALLAEMIPADQRERLHSGCWRLAAALSAAETVDRLSPH